MKKIAFVFSILIALCFVACKKQVAGPQGDPGVSGATGNSNQAHTTSFTIKASAWDSIDTGTDIYWQTSVFIPEITKLVLQSGEVKVYESVNDNWFGMPYFEGFLQTQNSFVEGRVILYYKHIHGNIPNRPPTRNFRVVVLSPK
jgi:hypothetical protein